MNQILVFFCQAINPGSAIYLRTQFYLHTYAYANVLFLKQNLQFTLDPYSMTISVRCASSQQNIVLINQNVDVKQR